MFSFYLLFLIAFTFSILFLVQIGFIIYKIYKKKENFLLHIVLAIIFVIASVACTGYAVLSMAQKIACTDSDYNAVLNDAGKNLGKITSSTMDGFLDGLSIESTETNQNNSEE